MKRILAGIVIAAALILIFIVAFRVRDVQMTGTGRYDTDQILEIIDYEHQPHHTLLFYLKNREIKVENVPFVERIETELVDRHTLRLHVQEKAIVGCIRQGSQFAYFDSEGIICEFDRTGNESVPQIEGLSFDSLDAGERLKVDDERVYDRLLTLTLLLQKFGLTAQKVIFEEDGTLSMRIDDIRVLLGEGDNLEDKISELQNLMPSLEGLSGTLHLETYDTSKDSVIFTKDIK